MVHNIKILPTTAEIQKRGFKPWELRKDIGFKIGDIIEYEVVDGFLTRTFYSKEITYISKGGSGGLEEGYVILSLKEVGSLEFRSGELEGVVEFLSIEIEQLKELLTKN